MQYFSVIDTFFLWKWLQNQITDSNSSNKCCKSKSDCFFFCNCRTLTAPVKLIKCLKAIKSNAFVASKYPLIITFEDHLTPDLQAKVARVIKTF